MSLAGTLTINKSLSASGLNYNNIGNEAHASSGQSLARGNETLLSIKLVVSNPSCICNSGRLALEDMCHKNTTLHGLRASEKCGALEMDHGNDRIMFWEWRPPQETRHGRRRQRGRGWECVQLPCQNELDRDREHRARICVHLILNLAGRATVAENTATMQSLVRLLALASDDLNFVYHLIHN